ncbi:dihydrofolate reductase family protein [Tessaracoccus oleiagri]|uniref:Dihydrofolate reductase n=1 Tax=Tessaracoccus oleiagri TaxID=686624 RepID=A0A1G9JXX5_9ACTN|nr:dihydrofolate reductase family protein [Tessaracoccus oleiagri]SDL42024.1 Dihydrofolate reductase [Tessaracoccus oleiagri]
MGTLSYGMTASLDGFVNSADGTFDWGTPDEEVHDFILEQQQRIGTYLIGRRMFETMRVWDEDDFVAGMEEPYVQFTPIWRAADKIVFSSSLEDPGIPRTRVERSLDIDAIRRLKSSSAKDLEVAGPTLGAAFLRAGIVDELCLYIAPVVVGGGTRLFQEGLSLNLTLLEERRFGSGTVFLRYGVLS